MRSYLRGHKLRLLQEQMDRIEGERAGMDAQLRQAVVDDANAQYDALEANVAAIGGEEQMRNLERMVILPIIDTKWREHLYEMDYLKEGIGLRAMAQRDPLVEYQREGFQLFEAMNDSIKEESVGYLFNTEVEVEQAPAVGQGAVHVSDLLGDGDAEAPKLEVRAKGLDDGRGQPMHFSAPSDDGGIEEREVAADGHVIAEGDEVGSNRAQRRAARRKKGR